MSDNYTCKLDNAMLKMAIEELNEVPEERLSAVETLRQWVVKQPHVHFITDTDILLRYLRAAKFSQLRARELIEGCLTVAQEMPKWTQDIDPTEKRIQAFINTGYIVPLPGRDELGRKIFIYRMNKMDPESKEYDKVSMMRAFACIFAYYLRDENTQMHLHGNNLESIYKVIPKSMLPEEYLPDDYEGPNAGPIQTLIGDMKKDISNEEFRKWMREMSSSKYKIDLSKKPSDVPQASFRKLNV